MVSTADMIQLMLGAEANAGRFHYVVAMGMRIIKALHGKNHAIPSHLVAFVRACTSCPHNLPSFAACFEKRVKLHDAAGCIMCSSRCHCFFFGLGAAEVNSVEGDAFQMKED